MPVKSYETLRKMAKARLDREVALLLPLRESLDDLARQKEDIRKRMEGAILDPVPEDPGLSLDIYYGFMKSAFGQITSLDSRAEQVRERIRQQEAVVRERFADMRRYEIVIENELEKQRKEFGRRETLDVEDIGQSRSARALSLKRKRVATI